MPRPRVNRRRVATTKSLPATVRGLNAIDSIAAMDPRFALTLDNCFPEQTSVRLIKGASNHTTGLPATVLTIMPYAARSGTTTLWGLSGGNVYNVSTAGAVGAAAITGLSASATLQWVNCTNAAGDNFLLFANGVNTMRIYDGTAWAVSGITGPTATSDINNLFIHKRRVWLIEKASMSCWYLPVDTVTGASTEFFFGPIFSRGGYLVAGGSWSLDAGVGLDDHFVLVTSEGEVAIYKGTDPNAAATWALVGVYYIAPPVGRNCLAKLGGDLALLTVRGVYPLSQALQSATLSDKSSISRLIDPLLQRAWGLYKANLGWQILTFAPADMLLINVPTSASTSFLFVMNTLTGAWCTVSAYSGISYLSTGERLWIGGSTKTLEGWTATGTIAGTVFDATILQAFSYFTGNATSIKRWTMSRITVEAQDRPSILAGLNVDFRTDGPVGLVANIPTTSGLWDVGLWDAAIWAGGTQLFNVWQSISGIGYAAALSMKIRQASEPTRWLATDFAFEEGIGVL